ncbi:hypothetical protein QTP70_022603, partial [Hemibagrus guttatus]
VEVRGITMVRSKELSEVFRKKIIDAYESDNITGHVWREPNTTFQQMNLIPTMKHGGGSVMVWVCFAAAGPGQLTIIESIMNSTLYQKVLETMKRALVAQW